MSLESITQTEAPVVAYIVPRPPESGAWLPVAFYTQSRSGFHVGIPDADLLKDAIYSRADMNELEADGAVHKVAFPSCLGTTQIVWITPERDVYIADEENPIDDPCKVKLVLEEMTTTPTPSSADPHQSR